MTTIGLGKTTQKTVTLLNVLAEQYNKSNERLNTQKAVTSALDDPSAYFTAQSLNNQAATLDRTVEQLGQGVQVATAASHGLDAIASALDDAKAAADQAASSDSVFDRMSFAQTYNDLLDGISSIADDSGYAGKNLLLGAGHDLSLYFGDGGGNSVTVGAVDYTDLNTTLGLSKLETGSTDIDTVSLGDASTSTGTLLTDTSLGYAVGDEIAVTNTDDDGNVTTIASLKVGANTTVQNLLTTLNQLDSGLRANLKSDGTLEVESASNNLSVTGVGDTMTFDGAVAPSWLTANDATATADLVTDARDRLRQDAAGIGNSLAVLQNRSDFMETFSSVLQTSSAGITQADSSEEAARLLALQTQQSLATSSLSLSNELDSGILRLLGG